MDFLPVVFGNGHGGAASVFAGFERFADAAAGGDHDEIVQFYMADDPYLAAEHDVFAGFYGAGDAGLSGDDVVFTDFDVVSDLDKVVDFGSFTDDGGFEAGPIDGGVGADFDVVFENDDAELFELDMAAEFVRGIAKTARADDGARLENDPIA